MPTGIYKRTEECRRILSEAHKGKKFTEETRKKLSYALKGNKNAKGVKHKKPSHRKGKPGKLHTQETKDKISKSNKGKKLGWRKYKDINLYASIINSRHYTDYRMWKKVVHKKDNYTCQKCKIKGKRLIAHHIFNYSKYKELRTVVSNGITLCDEHHKEFHKIYGNRENNKEQIEEYIGKKL